MNSPICSDPRIIINPKLAELLTRHKDYILRGKTMYYSSVRHPYDFCYSPFSVRKNGITLEDCDNSFVIDKYSGELYPIYLVVPCGKCALCKTSKINSFVHRCKLESQCYDYYPYFVTLTYDEEHCPYDGVRVRDAQLFLKRFRRNLERAGYDNHIRYVLVGEYGKNTKRPHYHAIIWNLHATSSLSALDIHNILESSWSNGFIMSRLVDMKNDKAFYYTAKYLKKDCEVPIGCNDTFMLSSRGHGGIGSRFIDKHSDELRRTLNFKFKFLNKFTGRVEPLVFCRYILDRVFPSFCRSVPSEFRKACVDLILWSHSVVKGMFKPLDDTIKRVYDKFKDEFYIPTLRSKNFTDVVNGAFYANDCVAIISKYIDKVDCKLAHDIDVLRNRFLGRLFEFTVPPDLVFKRSCCERRLSYVSAYEVL